MFLSVAPRPGQVSLILTASEVGLLAQGQCLERTTVDHGGPAPALRVRDHTSGTSTPVAARRHPTPPLLRQRPPTAATPCITQNGETRRQARRPCGATSRRERAQSTGTAHALVFPSSVGVALFPVGAGALLISSAVVDSVRTAFECRTRRLTPNRVRRLPAWRVRLSAGIGGRRASDTCRGQTGNLRPRPVAAPAAAIRVEGGQAGGGIRYGGRRARTKDAPRSDVNDRPALRIFAVGGRRALAWLGGGSIRA